MKTSGMSDPVKEDPSAGPHGRTAAIFAAHLATIAIHTAGAPGRAMRSEISWSASRASDAQNRKGPSTSSP